MVVGWLWGGVVWGQEGGGGSDEIGLTSAEGAEGDEGRGAREEEGGMGLEEASRLLRTGRAALEDGLGEMAERMFREVAEKASERRYVGEAALWLGKAQLQGGKVEEGLATLAAYAGTAKDGELRGEYALAESEGLEAAGRGEEAEAKLREALESCEGCKGKALARAAALALSKGDAAAAADACAALEGLGGEESPVLAAEARRSLAQWLDGEGRAEEAREQWAALAESGAPEAYRDLAAMEVEASGLAEADAAAVSAFEGAWCGEERPAGLRWAAWMRVAERRGDAAAADRAAAAGAGPGETLEAKWLAARLRLAAGEVSAGRKGWREAVAADGDADRAAGLELELAETLAGMGEWAAALEESSFWMEAFGGAGNAREGEARRLRAAALGRLGRTEEAADEWERAAGMAPEGPEGRAWRRAAADAAFAAGRHEKARAGYLRCREELPEGAEGDGERADLGLQLAKTALAAGNEAEGELILLALSRQALAAAKVGEAVPEAATEAALRLGALYEERGAEEAAIEHYGRLIGAGLPEAAESAALLARGLARMRGGSALAALDDFSEVAEGHPGAKEAERARFLSAQCLYLLGKEEEATAAARAFAEECPESAYAGEVRFWLGESAFNRGEYGEAAKRFAEAAAAGGARAADALYWEGRSWEAMHAPLEANRAYNEFLSRFPGHARAAAALLAQGDVLCELGQFAAAILAFDEVIAKAPGGAEAMAAWGRKGDCQYTLGAEDPARYEEAVLSYRALRDFTGAPEELRLQAGCKLGRCLEKTGHAEEAAEQYMETVYGWLQLAEPSAESAVWFARAAFGAAGLQEKRGNWEAAMAAYRRVAESGTAAAGEAAERLRRLQEDHWFLEVGR